jgi:hypothetical protein
VDPLRSIKRLFLNIIKSNMPTSTLAASESTPKKLCLHSSSAEQKTVLKFVKISDKAQAPTKGSPLAAGYDLYSAADVVS